MILKLTITAVRARANTHCERTSEKLNKKTFSEQVGDKHKRPSHKQTETRASRAAQDCHGFERREPVR